MWTDAAAAGLDEIKTLLASNPVLTAPNIGEPMLLYIAATHQVVSAVLIMERGADGYKFPLQKPVYYVVEWYFGGHRNRKLLEVVS